MKALLLGVAISAVLEAQTGRMLWEWILYSIWWSESSTGVQGIPMYSGLILVTSNLCVFEPKVAATGTPALVPHRWRSRLEDYSDGIENLAIVNVRVKENTPCPTSSSYDQRVPTLQNSKSGLLNRKRAKCIEDEKLSQNELHNYDHGCGTKIRLRLSGETNRKMCPVLIGKWDVTADMFRFLIMPNFQDEAHSNL